MKTYLKHLALLVASLAISAIPTILASPAVKNFIDAHPFYAAYFPIISAALLAIYERYGPKKS